MKPTQFELLSMASSEFQRNADTMVAAYIIKHPKVDPADIELVVKHEKDGMRFFIAPKELHVPDAMSTPPDADGDLVTHSSFGEADAFMRGWNAARDQVIAMAKDYRGPDAQVAPLVAKPADAPKPQPAMRLIQVPRG